MATDNTNDMGILSQNETLGIIGGGNMAQAIMFPLFEQGLIDAKIVIVSATTQETLENWKKYNCRVTQNNGDIVGKADIIMWAVKPHVFQSVADDISKNMNGKVFDGGMLHISIMAGITLNKFSTTIKDSMSLIDRSYNFRTIRVMPNIGLQVSCGVTVFACGPAAVDYDKNLVRNMFEPLGLCYECQEPQINAYCGLFGSGIGFMFPILEALSDGAVKVGIPRARSLDIAAQVMKGAGELYLKNKMHPAALKDMVCSPSGTTIAGIAKLEEGGVRSAIIKAVEAATIRGQEIGAAVDASSTNNNPAKP